MLTFCNVDNMDAKKKYVGKYVEYLLSLSKDCTCLKHTTGTAFPYNRKVE